LITGDPHGLKDEDRRFLEGFHSNGPKTGSHSAPFRFSHREHVRLAWEVMQGRELGDGLDMITRLLKGIAESHGDALRYHETLTLFWGRIVHHAIRARPEIQGFDNFVTRFPFLLDKGLPLRHWTSGALWGVSARLGWTEPDLQSMPEF